LRAPHRRRGLGPLGHRLRCPARRRSRQELTVTTAFVLSGGGSLGAVQVGMLQALGERDVRPDLVIGTSAGAINAAYVAGHGTGPNSLEVLANTWRGLRRQSVFPFDPLRHLLALAGSR